MGRFMEMFRYNFTPEEKEKALEELRKERNGTKRKPFFYQIELEDCEKLRNKKNEI